MKLREYQDRDYKEILNKFSTVNKVIYQCPTGGGKSLVIAQLIIDNKDKRILFLSHKREIISQMRNRLSSLNIKAGYIISSTSEDIDSNIIIGSISTMMRDKRMEEYLDKSFDYIIIDEAHRTRTSGYEKVLDHLFELNPNVKLFGVTATPYRMDKKPLSKYYDEMVISDDIETLIKNGYLSNYKAYTTNIGDIDKEVETNSNEYQIQSLSKYMRKDIYLKYLVDSYAKLGNNKQMIVFCVDKKHALTVKNKYIESGYISIDYIDSDTPEKQREQILSNYRKNKLQIIVCIETMTEGVDLPETGVIQLARPTKSLGLYLQMLGRGTRIKEDKSELVVLDCAGNTKEHGSLSSHREWSLNVNVNPSQKRKKNKIIAKREDGSYTDDLDEMDFLEIEEVNPEDYIMKMGNDISLGEKINTEIIEKQYSLFQELIDYLVKHNSNFLLPKTLKTNSYFTDYVYISTLQRADVEIKLKKTGKITVSPSSTYNLNEDSYMLFYSNLGDLCKVIMNPKHSKIINSLCEEIYSLNNDKIDLNEIKTKVNELKKKKFEVELENHIIKYQQITLPSERSISNLFPRDWGYFNKMEFDKPKLNKSTNSIKFIKGDGRVIKSGNVGYDKLESFLFSQWEEIKKLSLSEDKKI